jgi:DNA replication licensing factor MCM4
VLLCGDPGTSKSQLLQYVHKLAPRGIYTSGKGSSSVGLTAYITKDPETGQIALERSAHVVVVEGKSVADG